MEDRGPQREYDENSAELQWLEDSANDVAAVTCSAAAGFCCALCAFVWYSGVLFLLLINAGLNAFKK